MHGIPRILYTASSCNSDNSICLSTGRDKGGINGERKKKSNEEWLNIF